MPPRTHGRLSINAEHTLDLACLQLCTPSNQLGGHYGNCTHRPCHIYTMASGDDQWRLSLPGFTPTNINYTAPDAKACLVCRDYSEIDAFARGVTLQNLQPLFNDARGHTSTLNYNPRMFDATVLLQSLKDIEMPTDKVLLKLITDSKIFKAEPEQTLRVIFSQYANFLTKATQISSRLKKRMGSNRTSSTHRKRQRSPMVIRFVQLASPTSWTRSGPKIRPTYLCMASWRGRVVPNRSSGSRKLWSQFIQAKHHVAGYDVGPAAVIDDVARARLLYTWLGLSVAYDYSLLELENSSRLKDDRPIADILSTTKEVCRGYADLFVEMFLAMRRLDEDSNKPTPPANVAHIVRSLARTEGGPQPYAWDAKEIKISHRWCTFSSSNDGTSMKVIDPTWGRGASATNGVIDSTWFCMSNASMALSHIPGNVQHFYSPLLAGRTRDDV